MVAKLKKKTTTKTAKTSKSKSKLSSTLEPVNGTDVLTDNSSNKTQPARALRLKRSYAITILAVVIIVGLLYLGRNLIVAAMVNGQPISRLAVVNELEKQGGKQALDSLITKQLILQEARKKNINISQKEIDAELKKISDNLESQGQKLDQVLSLQGMSKDQLVDQIRLQKMLEKMVGKIDVTDKEVQDYITANQESLPTDQDEASLAANVKNSLSQQKLNQKAQDILENLRKNARINYFVQY